MQPVFVTCAGRVTDEIEAGIRLVRMNNFDLSTKSKAALLSTLVADLLMSASHNDKKFNQVITAMKPWRLEDAETNFFEPADPQTWALSNINFSEKARVDWFLETIWQSMCIDLIGKGEPSSAHLAKFCGSWLKVLSDEVAIMQAGDYLIAAMEVCLKRWRIMLHLIEFNPIAMQADDFQSMVWLNELKQSAGDGVEVSASLAVDGNDFCSNRMSRLIANREKFLKHESNLSADNAFCADIDALEPDPATMTHLAEMSSRICSYLADLPEELIKNFLDQARKAVVSVVKRAVKNVVEGGGTVPTELCKMMSESRLAFSLDEELESLNMQLAECIGKIAKNSQMKTANGMVATLAGKEHETSMEQIVAFVDFAKKQVPITLDQNMLPTAVAAFENCEALLMQVDMQTWPADMPPALEALRALVNLVPESAKQHSICMAFVEAHRLLNDIKRFENKAATIAERLEADTSGSGEHKWPTLASVQSRRAAIRTIKDNLDIPDTAADNLLATLMKKADVVIKGACDVATGKVRDAMNMAHDDLMTVASAGAENLIWDAALPLDADFATVTKRVKDTIMKIPPTKFKSATDAMNKVAVVHSP